MAAGHVWQKEKGDRQKVQVKRVDEYGRHSAGGLGGERADEIQAAAAADVARPAKPSPPAIASADVPPAALALHA